MFLLQHFDVESAHTVCANVVRFGCIKIRLRIRSSRVMTICFSVIVGSKK